MQNYSRVACTSKSLGLLILERRDLFSFLRRRSERISLLLKPRENKEKFRRRTKRKVFARWDQLTFPNLSSKEEEEEARSNPVRRNRETRSAPFTRRATEDSLLRRRLPPGAHKRLHLHAATRTSPACHCLRGYWHRHVRGECRVLLHEGAID